MARLSWLGWLVKHQENIPMVSHFGINPAGRGVTYVYEHVYSPIRQTQTEKYRYIQRDTKLNITKYIIIEMGHQITNSFIQWNKNSLHALITVKNHERPEYII